MADSANALDSTRVAFLIANEGTEQVELTEPWKAVEQAGGTPTLITPDGGTAQLFNHLDKGDTRESDATLDDVSAEQFDALVLPGGVANPDFLRMQPAAVDFVRSFFDSGKPVAVICHGPWTIVEADRVRDRHVTSWPSLQTDIRNAGGTWSDEEVVVCDCGPNVMVSSRKPDDLPAFCSKLVEIFSQAHQPA